LQYGYCEKLLVARNRDQNGIIDPLGAENVENVKRTGGVENLAHTGKYQLTRKTR